MIFDFKKPINLLGKVGPKEDLGLKTTLLCEYGIIKKNLTSLVAIFGNLTKLEKKV